MIPMTENYHDFLNVEKQRHSLIPEEFPEGSYGSSRAAGSPVENKSSNWKEGQSFQSAFNYENKSLHENLPRKYPGAAVPEDLKKT